MIIIAIETSCDDTCVAIIRTKGERSPQFEILSNIISSQVKLHAKYGGVYPSLAKREHQKNLPIVLKKALKEAKSPKINLIAVTTGHGLEPCLWTGVNFAKDLAKKLKIPIIAVNHIEAHILVNFFPSFIVHDRELFKKEIFPAICLVVSGGHTGLILMKDIGKYQLIGETRDDAAGECFDKAARILGLGYPGGPIIAAKAAQFSISNSQFSIRLPRPMMYTKDYDFSFSGLKTAVLYEFKKQPAKIRKSKGYIQTMCREIQQSIIDVLIWKTFKAAKDFRVKSIILGGGVAANIELKRQFEEKVKTEIPHFQFYIPDSKFCTDNAAMIALAAYFHKDKRADLRELEANANLRI